MGTPRLWLRPRRVGVMVAGAVIAAPAIGGGSASAAQPCDEGDRYHQVQIAIEQGIAVGSGYASNLPADRERWCDLRTLGSRIVPPYLVCNYSGWIIVKNPDGSSANRQSLKSYNGCTVALGWFFHDELEDVYVENKRFTTKWKSDQTNQNWNVIGTLVD